MLPIFERPLAVESNNPEARYNLGVVELSAHRARDAIRTLEPLVESTQTNPDVHDLASSAYEEVGDTPAAVKLLRQAIVLDPKKVRHYIDLATFSFTRQSFQLAWTG